MFDKKIKLFSFLFIEQIVIFHAQISRCGKRRVSDFLGHESANLFFKSAESGCCYWRQYIKRMNQVLMFSNWIYISYCLMAENQTHIKENRTLCSSLFFSSCRNLGSSGPTLHRLVIYPFLDLRFILAPVN
jgi:hypothetical protein